MIRIEAFLAAPEMRALELMQQVTQPFDLLDGMIALGARRIAFGDDRIALGERTAQQTAQRINVIGKGLGEFAHTRS